ncbi:MAG: hypothetical protein JHD16_18205, partial [Solirubrobacteraceae bacterium]|nr:hypothetical protein [Solirubrobacteraceae bacterium]
TLRAKVKVTALSRKKVIAQSRRRTLREGTHRVTLKVSPKRWPSSIKLDVRAP